MAALVTIAGLVSPSFAESDLWLLRNTRVINVSNQVPLSGLTGSLRRGGYELAGGGNVNFEKWYRPKGLSFYAEMRTELSPTVGLLWGLSTGERGKKYAIDPALSLGLHLNYALSRNSELSMVARTWFWGKFREKTCQADYGQIGGKQKVNCRLAASVLPPKETLDYLAKDRPDRLSLRVQYVARF